MAGADGTIYCAHELRLDMRNHCLHRGSEEVALRPKTLALLGYFMGHPGRLLTKDELLQSLWADAQVSDAVLKVCVAELRQALRDEAQAPRFIRTAQRRGYWFIAPVTVEESAEPTPAAEPAIEAERRPPISAPLPILATGLIGRDEDLAALHGLYEQALGGSPQVVFVSGEAGIGKTSLVTAFLRTLGPQSARSAVGHCVEQRVAGDTYQPVLEALAALCQGARGAKVRDLLRHHAPTWQQRLPGLVAPNEHALLRQVTIGAPPERMLRELLDLVSALSADLPLVLVLEDLHWGDPATLSLITYLARARPQARLLLIAPCRLEEARSQGSSLGAQIEDLVFYRCGTAMALRPFTLNEVQLQLAQQLGERAPLPGLAEVILRRTEGNPLFVANVIEEVAAHGSWSADATATERAGWLAQVEEIVPSNLRLLVERRLDRMSEGEQRVLEAGAVLGEVFAAESVAAALALPAGRVERICEDLAQVHTLLAPAGVSRWPDGTLIGAYRFLHAAYGDVLRGRVAPLRRAQLHQRAAIRLEQGFANRTDERAAELARHFELGQVPERAIHYLRRAARGASATYAQGDALAALAQALSLVSQLPPAERARKALPVHEQRALVHRSMGDLPTSLAEFDALAAAAEAIGETTAQVRALLYLGDQLAWVEPGRALAVLTQALALAAGIDDADLRVQVRGSLGHLRSFRQAWNDEDVDACIAAAQVSLRLPEEELGWAGRAGQLLAFRSEYRAAEALCRQGLERALRAGDLSEYLVLHVHLSGSLFHLGELGEALDVQRRGIEIASRNGHRMWEMFLRGLQALTYAQACAFELAREMAQETLAFAQEEPVTRQSILKMSHSLLGLVHRELGEPALALKHLLASALGEYDDLAQRATRIYALSECWLALGEWDRAIEDASRLLDLLARTGERTMCPLGRRVLARAAMAQGRWVQAEHEIVQAITEATAGDGSIAAWRVWGTAAQIYRHQGQVAEAARCQAAGAALVQRMADGLRSHEVARQALLRHPEAVALLKEAGGRPGGDIGADDVEGEMSGSTILIVDDSLEVREALTLLLESKGYHVVVARSGEAALEAVARKAPDVILLDLSLPRLTGWDVLGQLRVAHPQVGVILMSARGKSIDRVMGLELGADDFVAKPFDPPELLARVGALLRRTQRSAEAELVAREQVGGWEPRGPRRQRRRGED